MPKRGRKYSLEEGSRGKEGSPSKRHSGTQVGICENEASPLCPVLTSLMLVLLTARPRIEGAQASRSVALPTTGQFITVTIIA